MQIRPEQLDDYDAIWHVHRAAFGRNLEADLTNNLRTDGALTLGLVAIKENILVGHIAFSPVTVVNQSATQQALALGPIGVLPAYQKQGIGSQLIITSLDMLRPTHEAVFLLGHVDYYPRFGFRPTTPFGIYSQWNVPAEAFMVLELQPNTLSNYRGTVYFHDHFQTT